MEMKVFNGKSYPATRKDAQAVKAKFYFTGEACKRGHVGLRYTSDRRCVECKLGDNEKRHETNKDNPEYRRDKRERTNQWREDNLKKAREMNRKNAAAYHEANKDNPEYREMHREYSKQHYRSNPGMYAAREAARRALLAGQEVNWTPEEWAWFTEIYAET